MQLAALHALSRLEKRSHLRQRTRLLKRLDLELYIPAEIDRYLLIFHECVTTGDRATRVAAVRALCNTEDRRVVSMLRSVIDELDARTVEGVILVAGSVRTNEARVLLEGLSRSPNRAVATAASASLTKQTRADAPRQISRFHSHGGIVARSHSNPVVKDAELVRTLATVKDPAFLVERIGRSLDDPEHLTAAVLGLALLGTPQQIQTASEYLRRASARSDRCKQLLAILEWADADDKSADRRLNYARLLVAVTPIDFERYVGVIEVRSKQACVAAAGVYVKRYGVERLSADLSRLIEAPSEPAQVQAFAAFALAALVGRPAIAAITCGLRAVDPRFRRAPDPILGTKLARGSGLAMSASAEALGGLRDPTAVPALLEAIWRRESYGETLLAIVEALDAIGDPVAIPGLARVARHEPSSHGNPDEGGGAVSEAATQAVRRLRREMLGADAETASAIYHKLLDSETALEERTRQLRHPATGGWLARRLTSLSMRMTIPTHRYLLAKCFSERCDPRQSVWQWLIWQSASLLQFFNRFWLLLMLGGLLVGPILIALVAAPVVFWWVLFARWIGAGLIGSVAGRVFGQWLGVIVGGVVTYIVATYVRRRSAGVPRKKQLGASRRDRGALRLDSRSSRSGGRQSRVHVVRFAGGRAEGVTGNVVV